MSRRRAASDSLDLLLDTICNTFGGILFIALLVVILLQLQGDSTEAIPAAPVTSQELAQLKAELTGRIADVQRLRTMLSRQRETLGLLAPSDLAALVSENAEANRRHDELQQLRENLLEKSAQTAEVIQRTEEELRAIDSNLTAVRQRVAALEADLEKDRETRRRELRTPVQRPSIGKSTIGCVLQYGRFYVWHHYDRFGSRIGLNTEDFIVLGDSFAGAYTTPKPTAGIPIADSADSRAALAARLGRFSREDAYITIVVRPDSFGEWSVLRDVLTDRGFEYRLMPADADAQIVDQGGTDSRVQ